MTPLAGGPVPGDPAAVTELAADLASYAAVLGRAGDGLRRIDTTDGWEGEAGDAFRAAFDGEPARWIDAAAAFTATADALDRFAPVVTWARDRAAEAAAQPVEVAADMLGRVRDQLSRAAEEAARAIEAAADAAPDGPGLARRIDDVVDAVGDGAAELGAGLGNAAASLGNAALNNPGTTAALAGGGLLVAASALGEVGGVALDATGVGLPLGLGLGTASTAGIVAGVGIAGAAGVSLAANALGPDRVQVFHADTDPDPAGATPEPPFPAPTKITGRTDHGEQRINNSRGDGGVNDEALEDAVANPKSPPKFRPDDYGGTYVYKGRDATVSLNERGEITSAWPKSSAGRRIPR